MSTSCNTRTDDHNRNIDTDSRSTLLLWRDTPSRHTTRAKGITRLRWCRPSELALPADIGCRDIERCALVNCDLLSCSSTRSPCWSTAVCTCDGAEFESRAPFFASCRGSGPTWVPQDAESTEQRSLISRTEQPLRESGWREARHQKSRIGHAGDRCSQQLNIIVQ